MKRTVILYFDNSAFTIRHKKNMKKSFKTKEKEEISVQERQEGILRQSEEMDNHKKRRKLESEGKTERSLDQVLLGQFGLKKTGDERRQKK